MSFLAGAFSYNDAWDPHEAAHSIAVRVARYRGLAPRVLHRDTTKCVFVVERIEDNPEPVKWRTKTGDDISILGDINYAKKPLRDRVVEANRNRGLLDLDVPGRWIGLCDSAGGQSIKLITDRFGSPWVYLADLPHGIMFSSDFGALAAQMRGSLTIDIDAAFFELSLGFLPADRTIYNQIAIAPPRTIVELGRNGIKELSRERPAYGDRFVAKSQDEKFQHLDEIFESTFVQSVKGGYQDQLILSLSAGFDSRFCLAFFKKYNIASKLCTFGGPSSNEVLGAQRIAEIVGMTTDVFNFDNCDWAQWQRAIQQLGMLGTVQWSGWSESWFDFLRNHGQSVTIGYLGDHLTGKKLSYNASAGQDWLQHWISDKLSSSIVYPRQSFDFVRPAARENLMLMLRDTLAQEIKTADYTLPHQAALHLNLYGRQRRRVAAQANLISRHLTPIVPIYDDALIDFFMNLDEPDLHNQVLYRSYGQDRFPDLFKMNELEPTPFALRAVHKMLRVGMAAATGKKEKTPLIVIDRDRMIRPNANNIISLAQKVAPLIEEYFDMATFCQAVSNYGKPDGPASAVILSMTNLCHLLDLYESD